jgi:metal-responsive CopG/Arc/MetJ family transcriptional regulator
MAKSERGSDKYSVRIPKELQEEMLEACKKDNLTPSELIRKALSMYLGVRKERQKK